jgi:hypothetical protein
MEPTIESLQERIAQLEAEAKIERQLNQVAADSGILPAALPDIRERVMRARPSDVAAYVATLKDTAPHLFGMPGSIGARGGAGPPSKPTGSSSGGALTLSEIAGLKSEAERAKALQALMDQERSRGRAR